TEEVADDGPGDIVDLRDSADDQPVIKLVNQVIAQAVEQGASDVHLEPDGKDLRVRFRIDGVLAETTSIPKRMVSGVISRVKIMGDLDIAERRVPQDGRVSLTIDGHHVDLRVVTLPSVHGESVVMRILDKGSIVMDLDRLGMGPSDHSRFRKAFSQAYGAVLVTGPTGSGKSTSLYASVAVVSSPETTIMTIEDPVEYRLPGVKQMQVFERAGLTFQTGLRAIVRADPDIIMVGEMRDRESARIAIEAALTGHLVLSTLHTNDAPSAVVRLTEMGVEPFLVGSALDCVLAQRLARRLCPKCKESYLPTPQYLQDVRFPWQDGEELPELFRPVGCSACAKTGYKGRLALHEVMAVSEEIEKLTVEHASSLAIGKVAVEQGMITLRNDGLLKVMAGVTSVEEIFRVVA
ncbi:MAG TPA: GspE/PulE family protein, partial [Aeromicrobium sp.]|nr:GspE/PulE family protein [Aeromicrobium sp.]